MSSKSWDKKYAGVNKDLIEELAELSHNQKRAFTKSLFKLLNDFQYNHKSLDEFGEEMLKLSKDNWPDYRMVPEELKNQSRIFAFAVVDIINKHANK
jgi:hypothetical protein